jgi:hypothetical protein
MLEAIRQSIPGVRVPIEPYDNYMKVRKRNSVELLNRLRSAFKETRKCIGFLREYDEMIVKRMKRL